MQYIPVKQFVKKHLFKSRLVAFLVVMALALGTAFFFAPTFVPPVYKPAYPLADFSWLKNEFSCTPFTAYPPISSEAQALRKQALKKQYKRRTPRDISEVTALYEQAATKGHWKQMYELGFAYHLGLGRNRNAQKALYWFQELEKFDIPESYIGMYWVYQEGIGVAKDPFKALDYIQKAAKLSNADALIKLLPYLYRQSNFAEANIALECAGRLGRRFLEEVIFSRSLEKNYESYHNSGEVLYQACRQAALMGTVYCIRLLGEAYIKGLEGKGHLRFNYSDRVYVSLGLKQDLPRGNCLKALFEDIKEKTPHHFSSQATTYPDLDERCPPTVKQPPNRH